VRGVDFGIGQAAFRTSVGKSVGEALLALGYILTAENIEEFDGFQICRLGMFDDLEHGVMGRGLGHEHGDIPPNRGLRRQKFE